MKSSDLFFAGAISFLMLIVVYPALGFNLLRHSLATYYAAFFGMIYFGLVLGYTVKRIADFNPKNHEHL